MKKSLYPHQQRALELLKRSLGTGHRRPVVQAPTGFGKTVLASAMVEGAIHKGNRIMFVVPAVSLIDQTVQAFYAEGLQEIGVIQADHPMTNWAKPIQVASVQTLQRRKHLPDVDVVVVDECHRWFEWYAKWFAAWDAIRFIGLSATPWTKGLGKHYDDLLIAATTQQLIDQGYLSDFRVFAPSTPDLSGIRTKAGDWETQGLAPVMSDRQLVADCVDNWLQHGEGRPTLCFAVDRAHASMLQEDFLAKGVPTAYIDAFTPTEERNKIARQFHDGSIRVVCNVGCLTTGVDWDVRCIVLARPTQSEILFTQIIGRGLRTAPGKDYCLIFDHSDTHQRLGFVTDIHHETLDDGKHKTGGGDGRDKPLPKPCASCGALREPGQHACPACGFKPKRQSDVEHIEGELAEIKRTRTQAKHAKNDDWHRRVRFFGELLGYAEFKGYRPGWAANQYRNRYGEWPDLVKDHASPIYEISGATDSWIKGQQIRFAKGRAKAKRPGVAA